MNQMRTLKRTTVRKRVLLVQKDLAAAAAAAAAIAIAIYQQSLVLNAKDQTYVDLFTEAARRSCSVY
jgi:hypothetical protein